VSAVLLRPEGLEERYRMMDERSARRALGGEGAAKLEDDPARVTHAQALQLRTPSHDLWLEHEGARLSVALQHSEWHRNDA